MVRKIGVEPTTPRIQGEYATIASLPDSGSRSENRTHLVHVMSVPSSPELYPDMYVVLQLGFEPRTSGI